MLIIAPLPFKDSVSNPAPGAEPSHDVKRLSVCSSHGLRFSSRPFEQVARPEFRKETGRHREFRSEKDLHISDAECRMNPLPPGRSQGTALVCMVQATNL